MCYNLSGDIMESFEIKNSVQKNYKKIDDLWRML